MFTRVFGGVAVVMAMVTWGIPLFAQASVGEPTNVSIVGSLYTNDTTPKFTWSAASGATWYEYKVDDDNWITLSKVYSVTIAEEDDGWHSFTLRAHNSSEVSNEVQLIFEIDTVGPTVPAVSPLSAIEDVPVTFTVKPTGESLTTECDLYVDGSNKGDMTVGSSGKYTKTYTFSRSGDYSVNAKCTDYDGNTSTGVSMTVIVTDAADADGGAQPGDLIKMQCGEVVYVNDPCTTVYYWGEDGFRHVFPNETVYFSWYQDYDDVIIVGSNFMSDLTIGKNVTLKPGVAPVKFATSAAVYAVTEGGILHHYESPDLVEDDYGKNWGSDLVIIADVFFSNYEIDEDIKVEGDYDPVQAEDIVSSIDDNFYPG